MIDSAVGKMPPKKRLANRDTTQDEFVKGELKKIAARFPFRDEFDQDLNGDKCDLGALCARSIAYLENVRSRDSTRFYLDMSKSNYVTTLYYSCDPPRWEEATKQNKESLDREPRNFNALWCKCQLYLRQMAYRPVKDTLPLLASVLDDPVVAATAKAELGVLYADLGPAFYQRSRGLLEDAIREIEFLRCVDDEVVKLRLVKWKFDLVRTYNRLMNKGIIRTYWDPSLEPSPSHADMFNRIRILVECIQSSGADPGFCGAGWVELGDAYKKYEENVPKEQRTEVLPDQMTMDCFETARRTAPDDVYVLERCGRHWRQRASDIKGFEEAIRLLERCVEMDDLRDVAFHHLGLAHRSVWLEKEGHDEARLHTNPVKKGGKKSKKRSGQNQDDKIRRNNVCRSVSEIPENFPENFPQNVHALSSSDNGAVDGPHPPGKSFCRSSSDNTSLQNAAPVLPTFRKMHSSPATTISQTLEPRYPKTPSEVQRHFRRPDYFDNLRAGNPLAKDPTHRDLLSARKYFKTASEIRQGKSPRYLIDLARTYLSTDDTGTARELLLRAARSTDYSSNDGAYLFEQLGLMEEKQVERLSTRVDGDNGDGVDRPDIEDVKNLFRQAIRHSAEGRERSRIAFYHLRDILNRQIRDCSASSEVLEEERLLLYTTIQDAKKAVEILETMKNSGTKMMWNLVRLFHERNRREDHEAAFTYLALLAEAEKLKENLAEDETIRDRTKRVLEIGEARAEMNPDRMKETLSKTFAWLVALNDDDDNATEETDRKMAPRKKICLLAPSSATPGTDTVERVLSDVIGVEYVRAYLEDSPDIPAGTFAHEEIEDVIRNSTDAIVNMQMMDGDDEASESESKMQTMVRNFLSHPDYHPKRICQVVSRRNTRVTLGCFDDTLSRWDLDDDNQSDVEDPKYQTNLAFSLLRALFL